MSGVTMNSLSEISIQSLRVYQSTQVDQPPAAWTNWLNPTAIQDQPSSTSNGLFAEQPMYRLSLLCCSLEPAVVCYYTNWAQYRNGPGRFYPENIDPNLCTHVIYSFAQLRNGVLAAYEWNDESTPWSVGMFERMMKIRKGGRPKILLAVGGWNHGSGKFSDMVQDAAKRATFVTTTIAFLQKHKFDGLDLDWVGDQRVSCPRMDSLS
jgi:hypothetical protein